MDIVVFFFITLARILGVGVFMVAFVVGIFKITTIVTDKYGSTWGAVAYVGVLSIALAAVFTVMYAVT